MNEIEKAFLTKNCSLVGIATGERASSLLELRDKIATINEGCIYYHFWGGRMMPQFVHTQHHNDFASWVFHRLHDNVLAERLSVIDPIEFNSLEALRQDVLEKIEKRLEDYEIHLWTKKEDQFRFIRYTIVIFENIVSIAKPEDLPKIVPMLPPNSIFYHFIDARARTPERTDDFSVWLKMYGNQYDALIEDIQSIDPYFLSLTQLREELTNLFQRYFKI
jgi:septum formation topological specificity factor MinE